MLSWPGAARTADRSRRRFGACASSPLTSPTARLKADFYVFACGPWLGHFFCNCGRFDSFDQAGHFFLRSTRRRLAFYGRTSSGWATTANNFSTASPAATAAGFKVADDTRGEASIHKRRTIVSPTTLKRIREYVASRFPAMKKCSAHETRVCQYEQTSDSSFILDRIREWIMLAVEAALDTASTRPSPRRDDCGANSERR